MTKYRNYRNLRDKGTFWIPSIVYCPLWQGRVEGRSVRQLVYFIPVQEEGADECSCSDPFLVLMLFRITVQGIVLRYLGQVFEPLLN